MKVRVIKAYGQWSVGHIFTEMPGNVGRTLIARGDPDELENRRRDDLRPHGRRFRQDAEDDQRQRGFDQRPAGLSRPG
jgi:hypothetical protein